MMLVVTAPVTGTGRDFIEAGSTLEFGASVAVGQTAVFQGVGGHLVLNDAENFGGAIAGFASGDTIDLADFAYSGAPSIGSIGTSGGNADVVINDGTLSASLDLLNQPAGAPFALAPDGNGGTLLEFPVADHWTNASGGDWNTAGNWSAGVPTPAADVTIAPLQGGTVSLNYSSGAVHSLALTNGILFVNNSTLQVANTIDNATLIQIGQGYGGGTLVIEPAGATLTGGGTVELQGRNGGEIVGSTTAGGGGTVTLTNVNNAIVGNSAPYLSDVIGNGTDLVVNNQAGGVIQGNGLTLDPVSVSNAGLIESTGGYRLRVQSTTINGSSGGRIVAQSGNVDLAGVVIIGGTLATPSGAFGGNSGNNVIETVGGSGDTVLNSGTSQIANTGILFSDGGNIELQGALDNSGLLQIGIGYAGGTLFIDQGNATLTGGGTVEVEGRAGGNIVGNPTSGGTVTLTNVNNTIAADDVWQRR